MSPGPAAALLAAAGIGGAADRPALGGRVLTARPARRLPARAGASAARSISSARSRPASACSCSRRSSGRARTGRCSGRGRRPGARPARRDDDGARRGGAERAAADGARRSPSRPTRSCSTTTGSSRRPVRRAARRSRSRSRPGSCPRSSATLPGSPSRSAAAASQLEGARGYATLLSPLVAGSLERASNLAEAMEARGFGRPGATRAPRPPWSTARPARARRRRRCSSWWRCCGSSLRRPACRSPTRRAPPALRDVSLELEPGEVVALLGAVRLRQVDAPARARRARAALPRRPLRRPRRRRRARHAQRRGRPSWPARSRPSSRIRRTRS